MNPCNKCVCSAWRLPHLSTQNDQKWLNNVYLPKYDLFILSCQLYIIKSKSKHWYSYLHTVISYIPLEVLVDLLLLVLHPFLVYLQNNQKQHSCILCLNQATKPKEMVDTIIYYFVFSYL